MSVISESRLLNSVVLSQGLRRWQGRRPKQVWRTLLLYSVAWVWGEQDRTPWKRH